jgi:hypothetical protein
VNVAAGAEVGSLLSWTGASCPVSFSASVETATAETSVFVGVTCVSEMASGCCAVTTSQLATSSTAKTS